MVATLASRTVEAVAGGGQAAPGLSAVHMKSCYCCGALQGACACPQGHARQHGLRVGSGVPGGSGVAGPAVSQGYQRDQR